MRALYCCVGIFCAPQAVKSSILRRSCTFTTVCTSISLDVWCMTAHEIPCSTTYNVYGFVASLQGGKESSICTLQPLVMRALIVDTVILHRIASRLKHNRHGELSCNSQLDAGSRINLLSVRQIRTFVWAALTNLNPDINRERAA